MITKYFGFSVFLSIIWAVFVVMVVSENTFTWVVSSILYTIIYIACQRFLFLRFLEYVHKMIEEEVLFYLNNCYYVGDERKTYIKIAAVINKLLHK